MKISKCEFKMQWISFVMCLVILDNVEMEPDRVHPIVEWPESACHCNIQVFLSFPNFYKVHH